MAFDNNVFINCPFDEDYVGMLRSIIFTILYLGLTPRSALERSNAGETRISKILELIGESKYGIHDISRIEAKAAGEIFRLNMPFELGLDLACRTYGTVEQRQKTLMVLEKKRYRYQAGLSDLAGSDIYAHDDQPELAVTAVRNWLANQYRVTVKTVSAGKIWGQFNEFMAANHKLLTERGFSKKEIGEIPILELTASMAGWIEANVPQT